jgi:hypothetical protein
MKRILLLAVALCLALTASASAAQFNPGPFEPSTYTSKFNSKPGFLTKHDARLQSLGCLREEKVWRCVDFSKWGPLPFGLEIPLEWRLRTEGCKRDSKTEVVCKLRVEVRPLSGAPFFGDKPVVVRPFPDAKRVVGPAPRGKAPKKLVCRINNDVVLNEDMTLSSNYRVDENCNMLLGLIDGIGGGGIERGEPGLEQPPVQIDPDELPIDEPWAPGAPNQGVVD